MISTDKPLLLDPHMQPWQLVDDRLAVFTPFGALAARYDAISLTDMENVALLNRLDTKFVMTTRQLHVALSLVQPEYWMLEVEGVRLNHYRTLYFDTPAWDFYRAHINQRPERYKVRSREYADSGLAFLEVKHRTRKDRTIKTRISTPEQVTILPPELAEWLRGAAPIDADALEPRLWNTFIRMTLVNKTCCERVTLDLALAFANDARRMTLDGLAVAEVKMDAAGVPSAFLAQMRAQRIRPRGFSKYALGVALLYKQAKKNTLKPRLLWVDKLLKGIDNHA